LPAVSFLFPSGNSEHPPGSIPPGQRLVRGLVNSLMRSPVWDSSLFMWTYDDWGGWYDHVIPPHVDGQGYGFRAPALLVSPYAPKGKIDHTVLDFTSQLKFIEQNWDVAPLTARDASAASIGVALDFRQTPRPPVFLDLERHPVKPKPVKTGSISLVYAIAAVGSILLLIAAATQARMRLVSGGGR